MSAISMKECDYMVYEKFEDFLLLLLLLYDSGIHLHNMICLPLMAHFASVMHDGCCDCWLLAS